MRDVRPSNGRMGRIGLRPPGLRPRAGSHRSVAKIIPLPVGPAPGAGPAPTGAPADVRLAALEVWLLKHLAVQAVITVAALVALHSPARAIVVGGVAASLPAGRRAMGRVLASPVGHWLGLIAPDTMPQRAGVLVMRLALALALGVVAAPVEVGAALIEITMLRVRGARSQSWWRH